MSLLNKARASAIKTFKKMKAGASDIKAAMRSRALFNKAMKEAETSEEQVKVILRHGKGKHQTKSMDDD